MKIKYKYQKFQADAAKAVVDVFAGQPYLTPSYMIDKGIEKYVQSDVGHDKFVQQSFTDEMDFTGWNNHKIVPELTDEIILRNLQKIQRENQIKPSEKLEGHLKGRSTGYNLTIEMETGVGKTYTYIKTMYELNRAYGWCKFIIVVPSIAIREGVYKSFEMTQEHFSEEYGKKIRFFIYNSSRLMDIDHFASDSSINVMIINSQAFNAKGKDARRIYMELDEFRSRRPIDVIARTNPVLIIDEPQSVEGKQTKERLKEFNPLLTLRYSATHRANNLYNMVYRLDAMEAYNKHLVKKIEVKGMSESGTTATDSFIYLESINLSKSDPTATLRFDVKLSKGIKQKSHIVKEGDNLYHRSKGLEEYKNNFIVKRIDGRNDCVEFVNGIKIYAGDVIGKVTEEQIRRIQIRETILSHIEKERELFHQGIKVLSLFFIDEVSNYRNYNDAGQALNGKYANMFEEEYEDIIENMQTDLNRDDYLNYLNSIDATKTHAGYFSVDGKGKMINSKVGRRETTSDDVSAYELIMKNKELLLDIDPKKSPVRFIFSHSALREGWDNPNVFQICTLKQSSSEIRKRQEVGRGLRLCVNQNGERMDTNSLGDNVHNTNVLTVIASESYESFAKGLQTEIAEAVSDCPRAVTADLFLDKVIKDYKDENQITIDQDTASKIYYNLVRNEYIDHKGALTDKYYDDKTNGKIRISEELSDFTDSIVKIVDSIYDPKNIAPENARNKNVEAHVDEDKLAMPEFKELWKNINSKSFYTVNFDTEELISKAIESLNSRLHVPEIYISVEKGKMDQIKSNEELLQGKSFTKETSCEHKVKVKANSKVKYDLIGKLVNETGLTRKTIVTILRSIRPDIFKQFNNNPEVFILKAAEIINNEKATTVIEHITYNASTQHYEKDIFTIPIKGRLGTNAIKVGKNLYDHIIYDSNIERDFAYNLDTNENVAVYVKLPDGHNGFHISTPVGDYHPDWAIAFHEGEIKHIYFVAETKGSMNSMQLKMIENSKIQCARKHFNAISGGNITYDVVDSYKSLIEKVMK